MPAAQLQVELAHARGVLPVRESVTPEPVSGAAASGPVGIATTCSAAACMAFTTAVFRTDDGAIAFHAKLPTETFSATFAVAMVGRGRAVG